MSGSLLGRGRGGRLAVYAGCVTVVVLLVFAYRAAVSEMARLRDLNEQCTIHQESLQQRLQVIFDYKVRLEKSLADETSANAAVKQELQQRATREKSRRDKDSVEAMQRYNSLQQAHKILETERKDLKEECDKMQKQALADTTRLETTLQGLRAELKQARDDKVQSMEHLKTKYLQVDTEKTKLEEKYNELVKSNADFNVQNQRLQKEIFQLNRELEHVNKKSSSYNGGDAVIPSLSSPSIVSGHSDIKIRDQSAGGQESNVEGGGQQAGAALGSQNSINLARPPAEQQVSQASKNEGENPPQPIQAPRDHLPIRDGARNDDGLPNQPNSDVGFELNPGGMIVPVGPFRTGPEEKEAESTSTPASRMQTTRGAEVLANSKASTKASTQSAEKIHAERAKVKLPVGVLPIPKLFDPEKSPVATVAKNENNAVGESANEPNVDRDKSSPVAGHDQNPVDPPRAPAIGRHVGDQPLPRQENWVWQHKVPPGVQEVGEDPNNLGKIPELEDTGNHPIGDGMEYGHGMEYEGGDYDKEVPMKNNDLHIEEGEDEGEDEDDPMEYEGNNLKPEKHPE